METPTLSERITEAKPKHDRILAGLHAVEHAPSALASQNIFLDGLQKHLDQLNKQLAELAARTKTEHAEHEKFRDSTVRRFMYSAVGKRERFEKRADKEEREYYDALQKENTVKGEKYTLEAKIREATAVQRELQTANSNYERLQKERKEMYESLFAGPTPELPREDELEAAVKTAEKAYSTLGGRVNNAREALKAMSSAQTAILTAIVYLRDALKYSDLDVFGFGGSYADLAERNALTKAEVQVRNCQVLVFHARELDPEIRPLPSITIAQGNILGDILFDNIYSDLHFHQKIQESLNEVTNATIVLKTQLASLVTREAELQHQANDALASLETTRKELQQVRENAFLENETPPPYEEEQNPTELPVPSFYYTR